MALKDIVIKGAREHNLKNIDINIPKDKLVVITGLSGSGKSTLAFDTIYAEGQRRYVESLSSYARQFLGMMKKPDVDSIDGLSPAISIEQKTTSKNPRSTVGTVTEVYDYLRLLYARIGTAYCPDHPLQKIENQTPQKLTENIFSSFKGEVIILSPIIRQKKGTYERVFEELNKEGYTKVRVNGEIKRTDEKITLDRYKKHDIEVVIDKVNLQTDDRSRIVEAVTNALKKSPDALVKIFSQTEKREQIYSSKMACAVCGLSFEELEPRMFSFNAPFGACEECSGLGIKMIFDADLIIPDKNKSIADGAIAVYRNAIDGWRGQHLAIVGKKYGFTPLKPIKEFTKEQYNVLMYGSEKPIDFNVTGRSTLSNLSYTGVWEGLIPQTERLYYQTESEYRKQEMEKYMKTLPCPKCHGKRLKRKILAVTINKKSIIDVTDLSVKNAILFFKNIKLTKKQEEIAKHVLKEINSRLEFLEKVGLGYLTLSRNAGTLSGGEAQRIRLATNLGTNLTGVLYILDEPSIGLHQRDNQKLIETLFKLRDLGNTVIVVEHDEETILNADYVIDIGPGAGVHGGHITFKGTPKEMLKDKNSLTGKYLSKELKIEIKKEIRKPKDFIEIIGAQENYLKNISVKIPTGLLTSVTGVSGSGKSTLIYDILFKQLMNNIYRSKENPGKHKKIIYKDKIDKVISIDQSAIGRTPRSNPATYTKVFDEVRSLFAKTTESKIRGYDQGRFSFNVRGGRCEACSGDGQIKIEMNFLPDIYVDCEECKGKRYNHESLEIKYKGKSIADVLDMTVEEAFSFFENIPTLKRRLKTLMDVGLSYIKLGQSSVTLSGGEAQRIKITKELSKRDTGKTLYLLDEPTTGLHFHDVKKLIEVLNKLVDKGNSVLVIEHNLDVIKASDWIIDLGPEGGDEGGEVIFEGPVSEIIKDKRSYTGKYLSSLFS